MKTILNSDFVNRRKFLQKFDPDAGDVPQMFNNFAAFNARYMMLT